MEDFAEYFHRPPDQTGPGPIRAYQVYLFQERKLNARTVVQHTAALRFFFCKTLKRRTRWKMCRIPRRRDGCRSILTQEEAVR